MRTTSKDKLRVVKSPSVQERLDSNAGVAALESLNAEKEVCRDCFGTGMAVGQAGARRCDCQTSDYRLGLVQAARIPVRYQKRSLHNFYNEEENPSKYFALSWSSKFIDEYLDAQGNGLLFVGRVGVGKTHLAVAILRELIERYGVRGLFYQFGILLREIRNSYDPVSGTSELKVLRPVFDADVLVLDELGSAKPTDWISDTLMQIINTRYNDKKTTIFTTNYLDELQVDAEVESLEAKLQGLRCGLSNSDSIREEERIERRLNRIRVDERLEDRIGLRLRSRLYEMCRTIQIEGADYRKKLAQSG
jgi:DNA replication protein DnaC